MSSATINSPHLVKTPEYILWIAAILVGGFFLPGMGVVLGLILAFTRLRSARPQIRWSLAAIGAALLVIQIVGLAAGSGDAEVSPVSRVA